MIASSSTDLPETSSRLAPEPTPQNIGLVGLGHMGNAFASNLIADGFQVTVCDLDEKRVAPLVSHGAIGAIHVSDICKLNLVTLEILGGQLELLRWLIGGAA